LPTVVHCCFVHLIIDICDAATAKRTHGINGTERYRRANSGNQREKEKETRKKTETGVISLEEPVG